MWAAFCDDYAGTGGLKVYSDAQDQPGDVPADGILVLTVDGAIHNGYERYFWATDDTGSFWGFSRDTEDEILFRYPGADIKQGRWTPNSLWYKAKGQAALWSGHGHQIILPPNPVITRDFVVWTSKEVITSAGVVPDNFIDFWANNVPADDIQIIVRYLSAGGKPDIVGRDFMMGVSNYMIAPHPSGEAIFGGGEDAAEIARYSGAVVRAGKFIATSRFNALRAEAANRYTP